MSKIKVMTTEQYAKDVYVKYSKTGTATQQRIRKMITDGKELPQVVKIEKIGDNGYYSLLHVRVDA